VKARVMKTSDHWPCVIEINTKTPRSRIFRFENHWTVKTSSQCSFKVGLHHTYHKIQQRQYLPNAKKKKPQETTKDLEGKVTVSG